MVQQKQQNVYKTMVTPDPGSIKNLIGWRRPKTAYILLEFPQFNIIGEGEFERGMGLCTVNAESRAEVSGTVENILNKGGRIIDYGNFPSFTDSRPARAEKARTYSGKSGFNAWDNLERYVRTKMSSDVNSGVKMEAMEQEIDALRAKLAEQTAKKGKESDGSLHPQK